MSDSGQATAAPPAAPASAAEQQQETQPSQPQLSTPSALSSPSLGLQPESKSETSGRTPHVRLHDLTTAADLRCSFSHPYIAGPLEIMESIKGLHELHQQGGLTHEEFTHAKQQILDSGSSVASVPSTKSKRSRNRRHRRRGRHSSRSSSSSDAKGTRGKRSRSSGDKSHAKTRSSRGSHSRRSSSSSSSSDSSSNRFIVVPRANVWRSLNARLDDTSIDHDSAILHPAASPCGFAAARSPLLSAGGGGGITGSSGPRMAGVDEAVYPVAPQPMERRRVAGYESLPSDDALAQRGAAGAGGNVASPNAAGGFPPLPNSVAVSGSGRGAGSAAVASALARLPGSFTGSDNREKAAKYGTFLNREEAIRVGTDSSVRAELNREDVVHVKYFNSRGRSGSHFSDVELHASEMRDPVFLHKGRAQVVLVKQPASSSGTLRSKEDAAVLGLPSVDSQVFHLPEMTPDERKAWEEMTSLPSRSSRSPSSKSSYLEQSLNWYWIAVTGRDPSRKRYNATLRFLTNRFKLCESFLVDREHMLVLPQVCESPNYPGQYLLNMRVATDKIAISDDSVMELTNRWIIVVDLKQHVVITLHRVDTHSMANLRLLWRKVIENNDVSFQEFLLKIIDDAIRTYQTSIDVHADILDKCEAKLFVETTTNAGRVASGHYVDMRILHHFAGSSRSPFLRRLLDDQDRSPMNKGEMNSFLHHLHRRTSVQHRMLNLTQVVLAKAFTKLRLCSREMADQMCASCIEISDRALEVRDDAKTLLDLHISLQSFRTNELMAVLTRVSLLFTPVTFLAGVYGMNFQKHFPELTWDYGYPCFWVMCIVLMVVMRVCFLRER
ncbi:MGT1 magnesium transporter (MGT1) [Leptomonas pyrrhocoris]|uniref:MGT1 magnesium transporter (MGT1) n=1 Tax=Leptomonas pyrrhocoris TaxID=157538 RepID=A0A0M9FSD7_LEPPY|nr:MGT1 magnesium transporter (MGT1) [Leptomonas pyrrhocoris]XP_015653502.1 MGT1 magnesium transporter (MGT1) [Leptomonas pyrrhocoris]XP_015653503.1 MGT1 magnesium transporter (MGT1) [Leptomonas pyrrhocoris]XP_015653504.1 MGT1 magnesium transporter (MGT1) [Leptomonas pyrrhocoris]KPA75062.1 MGT1 magnesium transporter (MGT1) [Leptomonas pyrrhocoris]KPA75063.1 MGT1 magnesium transporter (MGT1) [Leptomonas pyrrhocoris]KPA75064.1 MGT1 magnesium transporter (MGT1) [Leptomonas pyrrhocoris]KPA75065.|eukprot:XP_015653501.1 MGT1 magnesium transporter (MGT1) [Leptomonas pyrrhocoris]